MLREQHFVGDDPQRGFRFYRKEERSLQELVDGQSVDAGAVSTVLRTATEAVAKKDGLSGYAHTAWHKIDVALTVHVGGLSLPLPGSTARGLELHIVFPPATPAFDVKRQASFYAAASHLCVWVLPPATDAESIARRSLKLKAGIDAYQQQHGSKSADLLRPEHDRLTRMQEEELPQAIRAAIQQGVVLYAGIDTAVSGQPKSASDLFAEVMKRAAGDVFTELEYGSAQVDDVALKKLRTWAPPQALPKVAKDLKLFDDKGKLLADHAFLKKLQQALKAKSETDRTGTSIVQHFNAAPYGWPERAVRAGLLALLRGRWLTVRLADGAVVRKQDDPRCENWITGTHLFNKGVLELSADPPPPAELERLTKLLETVFDQPGNDTLEKLERRADELFPVLLERARSAHADLSGRELPGADKAKVLVDVFTAVCDVEQATGRLNTLLQKSREKVKAPKTEIDALDGPMKVVRAVETLRTAGELDVLRDLRRRVSDAYLPWSQQGGGASVKEDLDALHKQVEDTSLLENASTAQARDAGVFPAYASDYEARHVERHAHASAALTTLAAHPEWVLLDDTERTRLKEHFAAIDCALSVKLDRAATPDGRCEVCDTSYSTLGDRLEQIELRLSQQRRALDGRARPGSVTIVAGPVVPATSEVVVLRDAADVRALSDRLVELVTGTSTVTVTVTVEHTES
jgi:hypothetical protein